MPTGVYKRTAWHKGRLQGPKGYSTPLSSIAETLGSFGMSILRTDEKTFYLRCHCGKYFKTIRKNILSGSFKSCGCSRQSSHNVRWLGAGEMSGTYWKNLKENSNRRGLPFTITKEEVWSKFLEQDRKCALSGETIVMYRPDGTSTQTASLDRINSSLGYISGNIQWVHKHINKLKGRFSDDEFIKWCIRVSDYSKERKGREQ